MKALFPLFVFALFSFFTSTRVNALSITFFQNEKFQGDSFTNQVETCQMVQSGNYSSRERSAIVNPDPNSNSSCVQLYNTNCCAGSPFLVLNGQKEKLDKDTVSISPCDGNYTFTPSPEQSTLVVNFLGNINRTTVRKLTDQTVAVYLSRSIDKSENSTWVAPLVLKAWNHVLKNYYTAAKDVDRKLYAVFISSSKNDERVTDYSTHMSCSAEWRNTVVTRATLNKYENDPDNSDEPQPRDKMLLVDLLREMSVIVEASNFDIRHSPSRDIWGQEGWRDIFIYDVLQAGLGYSEEAAKWRNKRFNEPTMRESVAFPKGSKIYYLRDWFYPIYRQHGKTKVLANYFKLLNSEFPKTTDEFGKQKYARRMNLGEFVHFWSGASQQNQKQTATNAFGWNDSVEKKFQKAQKEFENITYPK